MNGGTGNTLHVNFIEAARMLAKMQEEDPDTFRSVAKSLGVGLRKAYYLVQVARSLEGLPVSKDRLARVGWTKLQLISPYITASNCKTVLAQAEAHPVHEVKAILKKQGLPPQTHCVLFYLSNTQFDLLATVLQAFGAKRQGRTIKGKEEALVLALANLTGKKETPE
jgi:hypothetical protein